MDDDGNLLVSAVIALAVYGAVDLLRRISRLFLKWRSTRTQKAREEE